MPFEGKSGTPSPVNILRERVTSFLYWVKVGKTKFKDKKDIGDIFREMDGAKYLFDQATNGTMYDYKKKLERNVWAAAMYKYGGELDRLKAALLAAADACEAGKSEEEREAARLAEEERQRREEEETPARASDFEADAGEAMTEADCKELWDIYRHLSGEYRQMKKIADRWLEANPEKGCLGITLMMAALPAAAAYALFQWL